MVWKRTGALVAAMAVSLVADGAFAHSVCGPGSHWIDGCNASVDVINTQWTVDVDLDLDGNLDCQTDATVVVTGSMRVNRSDALDDSAAFPGTSTVDGHLDVIDTEIVSLSLSDGALATVVAGEGYGVHGALGASKGAIVEQAADSSLGDAFFNLFVEATYQGTTIYNHDPIPLVAVEDGVPSDASYAAPGSICIGGYTNPSGGTQLGNIVGVSYVVTPPGAPVGALSDVACVGGMAGPFSCRGFDLEALVPLATFDAGPANDLWGWTDPNDGTEYAILGLGGGTAFIDLSDPKNPVYLGLLPAHSDPSPWRDMKVDGNYAFIVSDEPGHGMQVFDLTQLASVVSPPVTFTETAYYAGFGAAHNIAIDEDTDVAYAVGSDTCGGGLHMIDISNPLAPALLKCYSSGYVHDTQCVIYSGPDTTHQGDEICFNSNPGSNSLQIVDVTNKNAPKVLSDTTYPDAGFTHQGWLTGDQRYFLMGDEMDELINFTNTRTYVWDVSDLGAPSLVGHYTGTSEAVDHNLYIRGNLVYEANYASGLRVLKLGDPGALDLTEVAHFDTYPATDGATLFGAWSVYPFFDSGIVIVSDMGNGLFVLRPSLVRVPAIEAPSATLAALFLGAIGLAALHRRRRGGRGLRRSESPGERRSTSDG